MTSIQVMDKKDKNMSYCTSYLYSTTYNYTLFIIAEYGVIYYFVGWWMLDIIIHYS